MLSFERFLRYSFLGLFGICACYYRGHSQDARVKFYPKIHRLSHSCLLWADDLRASEEADWLFGKFGPAFFVRS